MRPPLFNQERKMKVINQALHKKRKFDLKKLRIQQQQVIPNIIINLNTGFDSNKAIKQVYKKLELITPQEKDLQKEIYESKVGKRPANMPEFIGDIADPFDRKSSIYSDIEPRFMGGVDGERGSIRTIDEISTDSPPDTEDDKKIKLIKKSSGQYLTKRPITLKDLAKAGFGINERGRMMLKLQGYMMDDSSFGSASTGFVSESEGDLSEISGITRNRSSIFDDGGIDLT